MHEVLFHLGSFPVRSYGVMVLAGYLAAVHVAGRRARLHGVAPGVVQDLGIVALVAGLLGARLFYVAQYHRLFAWTFFDPRVGGVSVAGGALGAGLGVALAGFLYQTWWPLGETFRREHAVAWWGFLAGGALLGLRAGYFVGTPRVAAWGGNPLEIFRLDQGGLVLYGGVLAAAPACVVFLRRRAVRIGPIADLTAPSLALGLAFGRLGCFLNGCCFGETVAGPPGVRFPAHSPPWADQVRAGLLAPTAARSLPVLPTQVLASLGAFGLFWALSWALTRGWRTGRVAGVFLLAYAPWRFFVEILRNDTPPVLAGLTIAQTISMPLCAIGLAMTVLLRGRG